MSIKANSVMDNWLSQMDGRVDILEPVAVHYSASCCVNKRKRQCFRVENNDPVLIGSTSDTQRLRCCLSNDVASVSSTLFYRIH